MIECPRCGHPNERQEPGKTVHRLRCASCGAEFSGPKQTRSPMIYLGLGISLALLSAVNLAVAYADAWVEPMRGVYASACSLLGCRLPLRQDLRVVGAEMHDVAAADSGARPALELRMEIENPTEYPAPFPVIDVLWLGEGAMILARSSIRPEQWTWNGSRARLGPSVGDGDAPGGDAPDGEAQLPPRQTWRIDVVFEPPAILEHAKDRDFVVSLR